MKVAMNNEALIPKFLVEELKLLRAEAVLMREQIDQLNQHNQLLLNDNTREHALRQDERRRSLVFASGASSPCKSCLHLAAQHRLYEQAMENLLEDVRVLRSLLTANQRSQGSLSRLESNHNKFSVLGEK